MAKGKKVRFDDGEVSGSPDLPEHPCNSAKRRRSNQTELNVDAEFLTKESRHTLESDEDIEEEPRMAGTELEAIGQEPTCERAFFGDIRVTPFNMKDEMETGFFDANGCYQFDRKDDTTDAWLDNIDWTDKREFYDVGGSADVVKEVCDSDESDEDERCVDAASKDALFSQLEKVLNPGETVLKCIKRLGGNRPISARERWMKGKRVTDDGKNAEMLDTVIGIANSLLTLGVNDIYEYTLDSIRIREGYKHRWEYMLEDDKKVKGPLDTEEMIDLLRADRLVNATCRLIGSEVTDFQPVRRFDFDLYL